MAAPIWSVLQQALASGSRSTVLKPLGWLIALTLAGAISAFKFNPDIWFSDVLGGMCIASIVLYIVAYVYFGITDKDALRSETFSIQKMAIQKEFVGDDQVAYIPIKNTSASAQQIALPTKESVAVNEGDQ